MLGHRDFRDTGANPVKFNPRRLGKDYRMRRHPDKQGWVRGPFKKQHEGRTLICVEDSSRSLLYGLGNTYTLFNRGGGVCYAKHLGFFDNQFNLDCGWFMFVDSPPTEDEIKEVIG